MPKATPAQPSRSENARRWLVQQSHHFLVNVCKSRWVNYLGTFSAGWWGQTRDVRVRAAVVVAVSAHCSATKHGCLWVFVTDKALGQFNPLSRPPEPTHHSLWRTWLVLSHQLFWHLRVKCIKQTSIFNNKFRDDKAVALAWFVKIHVGPLNKWGSRAIWSRRPAAIDEASWLRAQNLSPCSK